MTEHSKIPVPKGEGEEGRGKTLLERAESMFGSAGYSPAPVPKDLAPPVNRTVLKMSKVSLEMGEETSIAERIVAPAAVPMVEALKVEFTRPAEAVDRAMLAHHGLIDPDQQATALLEEFRIVKRQVLQAARDARSRSLGAKAQRVLVSSPLPSEGKTFTACNIAIAMAAEKDVEVVLVDADISKPSLLSVFGLSKGPGLMDALANPDIAVEDCVIPTDITGLAILPAGHQTSTDSEYLASARTAEVLERLTQGAPERIVIFDSSPALAASPAAELAKLVGQTLVVARADRTGQSALEDTLSLLSACDDLKLVLNAAHFSPSGRRFGTYYGNMD